MDPRIAPLLGDLLTACQKRIFEPTDWGKVALLAVLLHLSPYQPELFMVRQYFAQEWLLGSPNEPHLPPDRT